MSLVVVDALVPQLADLDGRQGKRRRKDSQAEPLGEAFSKLRRKSADGVGATRDKGAGHEAGHADVHSVGLEARTEHLIE